jgi:flagellar protein FliL
MRALSDPVPPKEGDPPAAKPRSRRGLIVALVLTLAGGGAGFYATWSGLLMPAASDPAATADPHMPAVAFVPLDPIVISLGAGAASSHLRFAAQIEVDGAHQAEVAHLSPRILDVFNSYLRAIEVAEIEDPAALVRIRAQLLRRVQMVTGEDRVRDLLITEFVLN